MTKSFQKLGIRAELVQQLQELGISTPTPIQAEAIPYIQAGHDIIGEAQTGTGKTLAFILPMLECINVNSPEVQGLILTPTRELAIQITSELKKLASVIGARVLAAYGGQDVERQLRKLEGAIHIVVATPGRLLDHLRRGSIHFGKLKMLVLDEADQMLHMGFLPEVQNIVEQTPLRRQTLLFSATMPQQVRQLAQAYMQKPHEVKIPTQQITLTEISQVAVQVTDRSKFKDLCTLIEQQRPYLAVVFCRTKRRASKVNQELQEQGYASDELHGDLSQAKREQVMKKFREAKLQILVATDMAARGLDIEGVTHVFNYDIPADAEYYIHRIGRTGRAGNTGVAITFVTAHDRGALEAIERGIKMTLPKREISESGLRRIEGAGSTSDRGSRKRDLRADSARAGRNAGTGENGSRRGSRREQGSDAQSSGRGAKRGQSRDERGSNAAGRSGRSSERDYSRSSRSSSPGGRESGRASRGERQDSGRQGRRSNDGRNSGQGNRQGSDRQNPSGGNRGGGRGRR